MIRMVVLWPNRTWDRLTYLEQPIMRGICRDSLTIDVEEQHHGQVAFVYPPHPIYHLLRTRVHISAFQPSHLPHLAIDEEINIEEN